MDNISIAADAARTSLPHIECRLDEPMKNHTSFGIGGPIHALFVPGDEIELLELCKLLREHEIEPLIIGNGTNLLVDDCCPLKKIAIKTTKIDNSGQISDTEVIAGAGISLSRLAVFACNNGLSGLEFAHGIPGTLGGAITMNAGAYGREMKDIVHKTKILGKNTDVYEVVDDEHAFSYRRSRFSGMGDVILSSTMRLQKADEVLIRSKMDELFARRRESQPLELQSAGSTFKRPKSGYAATLIEQAGLKGFTIGGAQVSEKHSGFIVNTGGATFSDVLATIEYVKDTVFRQTGIELEPEIRIIKQYK